MASDMAVAEWDDLYHRLRSYLGLTHYEAKAYLALVRLGRGRPVEVSKESDVPQGRIYDVLRSLEDKGLVARTPDGYVVVEPSTSLKLYADRIVHSATERARRIIELARELESVKVTAAREEVRVVQGLEESLSTALAMLEDCGDTIYFLVYKVLDRLDQLFSQLDRILDKARAARILIPPGVRVPPETLHYVLSRGVQIRQHPGVFLDAMLACDKVIIGIPSKAHGAVAVYVWQEEFARGLAERLEELWERATPVTG